MQIQTRVVKLLVERVLLVYHIVLHHRQAQQDSETPQSAMIPRSLAFRPTSPLDGLDRGVRSTPQRPSS